MYNPTLDAPQVRLGGRIVLGSCQASAAGCISLWYNHSHAMTQLSAPSAMTLLASRFAETVRWLRPVLIGVVTLVFILHVAQDLWRDRRHQLDMAHHRQQDVLGIIDSHSRTEMAQLESMARRLVQVLVDADVRPLERDALLSLAALAPFVSGAAMMSPDGQLLAGVGMVPQRHPGFQALRRQVVADGQPHFLAPFRLENGDWIIPLVLMALDARKMPAVALYFGVRADYFLDMVHFDAERRHLRLTMITADGVVLASRRGGVPDTYPQAKIAVGDWLAATRGQVTGPSRLDGRNSQTSYVRIANLPILVVCEEAIADSLARWQDHALELLLVVMMVLLLMAIAASQMLRGEHARQRLALLEREKQAVAELAKGKARFLAHMSHELRAPLNAIVGYSELLRAELHGPLGAPDYRGYAEAIGMGGQHLLGLVNDILDMARLEAGEAPIREDRFDPTDLLWQVASLQQVAAEDAGVMLEINTPQEPLLLIADPQALRQMVLNLISNAVKFTPRGGRVTVSLENVPDGVVLAVADTGIGMTAEEIAQIGTPYWQAEGADSRASVGVGLGLAIVKALIERHGGRLIVTSTAGQGTIMRLWFPSERVASL